MCAIRSAEQLFLKNNSLHEIDTVDDGNAQKTLCIEYIIEDTMHNPLEGRIYLKNDNILIKSLYVFNKRDFQYYQY